MAARRTLLILDIVGVGALLVYLLAALNILPIVGSERITLALVFGIGPVAIVAVLGIHELLRSLTFRLLASRWNHLLDRCVRPVEPNAGSPADGAATVPPIPPCCGRRKSGCPLDAVFKGTNLIQLGIDVSFDVFDRLGVIALSAVMYREPSFGRVLGAFGIVSAAALLAFNLATFPSGPRTGLVDLGPVTGIWWLCVIVQIKRKAARSASKHEAPSSVGAA